MVALRSLLLGFIVPLFLSLPAQGAGLFETDSSSQLERRQAAVNGNVCATLDLTLVGITFARGVCICAAGGAITPASLLTLQTQIRANQGLLAPVLNGLGGVTGAATTLASNLLPILLQKPTSCQYPANASPNQCGGCGYECGSGFVACGKQCVTPGTTCISGSPQRRALGGISGASCPVGFEACMIPSASRYGITARESYECISTANDLESCGGCVLPLPGRALGQDCSAIPNVDSASCQAGRCVVESCRRGFTSNGSSCVEVKSDDRKLSGYWAALHEASHVILQD